MAQESHCFTSLWDAIKSLELSTLMKQTQRKNVSLFCIVFCISAWAETYHCVPSDCRTYNGLLFLRLQTHRCTNNPGLPEFTQQWLHSHQEFMSNFSGKTNAHFFNVSDPNIYYLSSRSMFRGNMSWAKNAKGIELDKWANNAFHIINSNTWSLVGNFTLNICGPDEYGDLDKRTNVDIFTTGNTTEEKKGAFLVLPHPPAPFAIRSKRKTAYSKQLSRALDFIVHI